jgi:hypothetical protein
MFFYSKDNNFLLPILAFQNALEKLDAAERKCLLVRAIAKGDSDSCGALRHIRLDDEYYVYHLNGVAQKDVGCPSLDNSNLYEI